MISYYSIRVDNIVEKRRIIEKKLYDWKNTEKTKKKNCSPC